MAEHSDKLSIVSNLTTVGRFGSAPGILGLCDAQAMAHKFADELYIKRVKYRRQWSSGAEESKECGDYDYVQNGRPNYETYLGSSVDSFSFRPDGKYWLFEVSEIKAGGSADEPDRFADRLVIRVDNDRRICVVGIYAYDSGEIPDITQGHFSCP